MQSLRNAAREAAQEETQEADGPSVHWGEWHEEEDPLRARWRLESRVDELEEALAYLQGELAEPEGQRNPWPLAQKYAKTLDTTDMFRLDQSAMTAVVVDAQSGAMRDLKHTDAAWDVEFYRRSPSGKSKQAMRSDAMSLARVLVIERLTKLAAVTHTPFIAADGHVVSAPGFDEPTGVYLAGGLDLPELGTMTVEQATGLLSEWVCDFPFASPEDRSVFFAAVLTLAARPMLGLAPMFLFDAARRDSGKSLLIAILTIFATGEAARTAVWTNDDTELEKRVTSSLRAGHNPVVLDEAHVLNSRSLSGALTADFWAGRILGVSTVLDVDMRQLMFMAAGNNQSVRGDLRRRVAGCRLAPDYTEEEGRQRELRHPDLKLWTAENRARLLTAALTLWKNWLDAGSVPGELRLGSFEKWSRSVSGCLEAAGLPALRIYVPGHEDEESSEGQWLHELREALVNGGDSFTAAKVAGAANSAINGVPVLSWPWPRPQGESVNLSSNTVGYRFRQIQAAWYDYKAPDDTRRAIRLVQDGKGKGGVVKWRLEERGSQ